MSRNPPGVRAPQRRHPAEDPYATPPSGQPPNQWGGPGYPEQGGQQRGFYFPQGTEPDPNYGYSPQPSGQLPAFERFPPPAPGYASQPQATPMQWNQQHDARGYDLGAYMPSAEQGHAPDPHGQFGGPPLGYGESDADYDESFAEEEEPRRGRRGLIIIGALVGAIGLGGALAYTYKTFIAPAPGRTPLVKALDPASNKIKPAAPGGKEFAHTDKKLLNRLGDDGAQARAGTADSNSQDERASDDPNAPRKVRIIPITPGGGPPPGTVTGSTPSKPAPPVIALPGITLDNVGPTQPPPSSAQRVQVPPQAGPPVRAVGAQLTSTEPSQPPVKIASMGAAPPPAAVEPAQPKKTAAPVAAKKPVPRAETAMVTSTSGISGFVAVLSSQKSRMDALKAFADLQQKYGDVLAAKTPDVQEANLGEKGVWYRAVVGPPASREAASGICSQLKAAGYSGCWVTAY